MSGVSQNCVVQIKGVAFRSASDDSKNGVGRPSERPKSQLHLLHSLACKSQRPCSEAEKSYTTRIELSLGPVEFEVLDETIFDVSKVMMILVSILS